MKLADSLAQVNPQVLLIEDAKLPSDAFQKFEAVIMKRGGVNLIAVQQ
jgi:hypothetical protein